MEPEKPSVRRRIALIDGNSFYCSCERAMRPAYDGRPLVVLSNNDGCVIARTAEAKALGIRMGEPYFRVRHLGHSHGLLALSANFSLYGDLSARMMAVIGQFSPRQEIYSIDESFLDLSGMPGSGREIGSSIRARVLQWVGIPTCVGVGPTKTLAKLANHLAKVVPRLQGVCDLSTLDQAGLMRAIRHVPVDEVWGVGRRLAAGLHRQEIHTAADLAMAEPQMLRRRFTVTLARTAQELRAIPCMGLDTTPQPRQQIMCSRSFGAPVHDKGHLAQALSSFAARAAEKLRAQGSMSKAVLVFIRTSAFRPQAQYSGVTVSHLPHPTCSTPTIGAAVLAALDKIYRPGFRYAKAGVCLLDLARTTAAASQGELFDHHALPMGHQPSIPGNPYSTAHIHEAGAGPGHQPSISDATCSTGPGRHDFRRGNQAAYHCQTGSSLMQTVDTLNQRFGRRIIGPASTICEPAAPWLMKQERMTPAYTTDWNQLIEIWR